MSWVTALVRPEILSLEPYAHAAWEAGVTRLHANELPWRSGGDESMAGLNRYPEPQARAVIERLSALYQVPPEQLLICRGSDEAIDLLTRAFCRPREDGVLVCPPTFGMYATAALIQGAPVISVPLLPEQGFELDASRLLSHYCLSQVKLVFLCSPNNPTGNHLRESEILAVADGLEGRALLVVDEAYVEFSGRASLASHIARRPHLAVLRTLSKAHGLAGARLGTLIADPEVIALVRKLIAPYAVPQMILEAMTTLLSPQNLRTLPERMDRIRAERARLHQALEALPGVTAVLPSEANFLLARFTDPADALERARAAGLLVRDARSYPGLEDALRITVGTQEENDRLLEAWA
jgi:histidinol-phosphate aminotransferase